MRLVCMSNTFSFKVIRVLVTARWTDFVYDSLLRLSKCSVVLFVNIYTCDSFIKNSNSVGIFFFASLPKFGEEVLQTGNRPLPS